MSHDGHSAMQSTISRLTAGNDRLAARLKAQRARRAARHDAIAAGIGKAVPALALARSPEADADAKIAALADAVEALLNAVGNVSAVVVEEKNGELL